MYHLFHPSDVLRRFSLKKQYSVKTGFFAINGFSLCYIASSKWLRSIKSVLFYTTFAIGCTTGTNQQNLIQGNQCSGISLLRWEPHHKYHTKNNMSITTRHAIFKVLEISLSLLHSKMLAVSLEIGQWILAFRSP